MSTIKLVAGRGRDGLNRRERQSMRASTVRGLQHGVAQAMREGHFDAAAKLASRAEWLNTVHRAPNWTSEDKDAEFKRTLTALQAAA